MGTLGGGGGGGGRTVPTSNVERQQCYPSSRSRGVARSTFCVHRLIPSEFNHQGRMRVDVLIAIFGACFILGHSGVDALECYVCNSYTDSRCSEKVPHSSLLQKCDLVPGAGAKYTMCRKTVQTIEFRVNGLPPETRVIRTCGYDESNYKGKCYQRGGFGGRQEVCSCLTDKCNSATKIFEKAPHFVLMLLCIIGTAARTFVGN